MDNKNAELKAETFSDSPAPPCKAACPVNTDAQRYVSLIAQERYVEALEVIMENNPFPGSIGRICFHPCESNCRRRLVDQPISICSLKRFVTDKVGDAYKPKFVVKTNDKTIGIIGAGPSGLTAAHDLARVGYQVTIVEAKPEAGGMLRHGILSYRLPKDILRRDIANILAVGIELQTGVKVGQDVIFSDLREKYDVLLIAVGLSSGFSLPLPGADLEGIDNAVSFLDSVNYGRTQAPGDEVIVIGGGNVAVDVARAVRRLGSKKVKMVCLESPGEMPAHDWELAAAAAEGVEMHCSLGPHRIIGANGRVSGLEFKEVACVFDEDGRFNPKFNEDERSVISGDAIIFSIGQRSELSFLKDSGVALDDRGRLVFDAKTMATSLPGVFATGEVAGGPGAAITAIAGGHLAAKAIISFFDTGCIKHLSNEELSAVADIPEATRKLIMTSKRQKMPTLSPEARQENFNEVELGFDSDSAIREALRCLNCTAGAVVDNNKCVACLTCVRVCPYNVPEIKGSIAYMDPVLCQSCGICVTECPANAIKVRLTDESEYEQLLIKAMSEAKKSAGAITIGITCQYGHIWGVDRVADAVNDASNVKLIRVLCPGRLSANDILKAFEVGADQVFITVCAKDYCHFKTGNERIDKKIGYLRDILDAVGIGADRLELINIAGDTSIKELVADAAKI